MEIRLFGRNHLKEDQILQSGQSGIRIELDRRGHSISIFTEINERTIVQNWFGELAPFDEIAFTLQGIE
jgi:hypothetical protein